MNDIWKNAPEGAERFVVERDLFLCIKGGTRYWFEEEKQEWLTPFGVDAESDFDHDWKTSEPRPTEEKADRHNKGKPELSYLLDAPIAVKGLSEVFVMGAEKYARDNWKKGLDKDQIIDSLLRHLLAYKNGELTDEESNLCHTKHVLWNALVLAEQHGNQ